MDKPSSDFHFKGMTFLFKIRDLIAPRKNVLKEVGIQPGYHVLDYGCGPGSYIAPLAKLVGESGQIYALDIHPLAVQKVQHISEKRGLENVNTIQSDCQTNLADKSMDVVLLYDTLHELKEPDKILKELHRILKQEGTLSLSDHHLKDDDIQSRVESFGLFNLSKKGKKTFSFVKVG
ncbi:MAG: class I SAM-dependent methyltransferase [Candidatus Aminicenantes bacterium]|nr:MAG: class I SAM-dependent methyltransferase [Candidatus Aminicenantes bacterium]